MYTNSLSVAANDKKFVYDIEHAMVNLNNIYKFHRNLSVFTRVTAWRDRYMN